MLKLAVASYDNAAPSAPLSAVFGLERRTLGRGEENFFVLPDPSREVAREQAAVWHDGAGHRIANLSDATPLSLNGAELQRGQEAPVAPGDQIRVGLYLIYAQEAPVVAGEMLALKEAFLRGAGLGSEAISGELTPEMMEKIGKLMATSLQGTIDLLALRSLVRKEVKAEVTMVVVRNNNPLKFFTDSQTVLTQMLRKKMPGFLEPVDAVEEAYADLRAHQMGAVAGMRASLQGLIARLKPATLASEARAPALLDRLLPWRRQAGMWQAYAEQHAVLAAEYEDPSKTMSGPAFLRAYEAEVERVNAGAGAGGGQADYPSAHGTAK
jgi:FHA domain-containing protein